MTSRGIPALNPRMTVEEAAEVVLTAHQRRDIQGCICGWSELGRSHPKHQVAMLCEAGLLKDHRAPSEPGL